MMNNYKVYWSIIKSMFKVDFLLFKKKFFGRIIDRLIWTGSYILIVSYLLPAFGVGKVFGPFMLAGIVASIGLLETYSGIAEMLFDLEAGHSLAYYLTLPIPPQLVFIRLVLYYGLHYAALSAVVLPFGNLLLKDPISYKAIMWSKFLVIFILINLFHGALVVFVTALTRDIKSLSNVWSRVLHPLWFFGGFQFSWAVLYKVCPWGAYTALLNPVIYTMEGIRNALLGTPDTIPFWSCVLVLTLTIILLTFFAVRRFQRRLDFV